MAKFLQIRSKVLRDKERKAFEKKYSAEGLKTLLKCDSVIELNSDNTDAFKEITKIPSKDLEDFARNFCYTDVEKLGFDDEYIVTDEFILSDDATTTPLSIAVLKEEFKFSAFELDEEELVELTELLDKFDDKDFIIGQLEEAEQLWESLRNIENELNIDLVSSDGNDEIESRLSDVRDEIESLTSQVNTILIENSWKAKKS
jgi:hypothetical protein